MKWIFTSLLLTLFAATPAPGQEKLPPGIRIHATGPAPDFELPDIDGATTRLSGLRGQWVFLHFWASWCGPCRKEMPAIQRLSERVDAGRLRILLVNTAEDEDTIFSFLAGAAPDLESLMDADGEVTETWKPRGLPATYLIDPAGQVRYQALGGRPWDEPPWLEFVESLPAAPARN